MQTKYVRLYSDAQGESHFEEVAVTLAPVNFSPPAAPLNFSSLFPATKCNLIGGSKDWRGDIPHPAPSRQLMCILQGEADVTASDGETRPFRSGDLLLVEDVTGKGHSSKYISDEDVLILTVALAE